MFNGWRDDIAISSNVENATVKVNGVVQGQTPCKARVKRQDSEIVEVSKAGYVSKRVYLDTEPSAWVVGDVACLLFLFPVPLLVDLCTGAWKDVTPDSENVILVPNGYKMK